MTSYDKDGVCELIDYASLNKALHIHHVHVDDTYVIDDGDRSPSSVPIKKHKQYMSRIAKNRLSAQKHREKKRQYIQDCEEKISTLEAENENLRMLLNDQKKSDF